MTLQNSKKIVLATGMSLLLVIGLILFILNLPFTASKKGVEFGATFSPKYAESLGLPWKEVYLASLDELNIRNFRLSAYWDTIEATQGTYNFSDLDFQLEEAAKRDAKVLLAVGRKLPRWPECHDPAWLESLSVQKREKALLAYVRAVVERYKNNPAVVQWQVENEPYFPFGICPQRFSGSMLKQEISLVRSLDTRPLVVTDTGEWSPWIHAVQGVDILGVSMYRESWNNLFGRIYFPIGPGYYQGKAEILKQLNKKVVVTELQVEPWGPIAIQEMSLAQMQSLMPLSKMHDNIAFSQQVGFEKVYLWGVEWWYLAKMKGDPGYWESGKTVYQGAPRLGGE